MRYETKERWRKVGLIFIGLSVVVWLVSAGVTFWLCDRQKPVDGPNKWQPYPLGMNSADVNNFKVQHADSVVHQMVAYLEKNNLTEGPVWSRMPSWGTLDSRYRALKNLASTVHRVAAILPNAEAIKSQDASTQASIREMLSTVSHIDGNYVFKHKLFAQYPGWMFAFCISLFGTILGIIKLAKEG